MIAGTQHWNSGEIFPDDAYPVSYLYQDARLLPWLNVLDNVMYLMDDTLTRAEKIRNALHLLEEVGLTGVKHYYPEELSGGMSRRVALARALGRNAPLLLMDEPFVSLDSGLKDQMIKLVHALLRKKQMTTICVTHDLKVAEILGDVTVTLGMRQNDATFIKTVKNNCANSVA